MYLYRTTSLVPRILLKIYIYLCWYFARKYCNIFNIPLTQKTDYWWKKLPHDNVTTIMLIWCLKQVKEFIIKCSVSGSLFSEKWFLILHTILVSFPSSRCVEEVVDNQQIIMNTNMSTFKYTITHWQSSILWMV